MRTKKKVIYLLSNLLIFCLVIGYAATNSIKISSATNDPPAENSLRVGVSTNSPPVIYKQGQQIFGLEAKLAREFAKYLGRSLHFVELKWEDQIPALLGNQIDIIRKSRDRFSHGYYSILAWSVQLKLGVVKATTGEFFVRKRLSRAKKISSFATSKEAVKALKYREVDMVIHDAPMILMLAAENESEGLIPLPSLLTEEYLAWGIRKNDVELLESANTFIKTLRNDGRLNSIVNRWIPFTN